MISPSRWSQRADLPHPIPHRAAAPRTTSLHLEWHVGGVKVSHHRTVTAAVLHRPEGGVLMIEQDGRMVLWSERGRQ